MPKKDPDTWMWERAFDLVEKADRLQRQFFQRGRPRTQRPTWIPPVDLYETETALWILVALPGVDPKRVEVAIDGPKLLVAGERTLPAECRRAVVHRMEIPQGRFERAVELPAGRYELDRREVSSGCLILSLKKLP